MKRKMLLAMLAAVPTVLLPFAAYSQIIPEKAPVAAPTEPTYKYTAFAGWGYTSINQVTQSNSGLQGFTLSVTRDWGRFFGVTVQGGHYAWAVTRANEGNPTVDMYLAGPELHASLYGPTTVFVHGLLGAVHTGGVTISPSQSFAGGIGMGMDYKLSPHFGMRIQGDDIGSSFTITPYEPGLSPHRRFNAHAAVGVTYKF